MFRYQWVILWSVLALVHQPTASVHGFNPLLTTRTVATRTPTAAKATTATTTVAPTVPGTPMETTDPQRTPLEPKDVVTRVAVAGATGRTGRMVVEELLARGITDVVALTRDEAYAAEVFPQPQPDNLQLTKCDLSNERELKNVMEGVDAVIWCATGFSNKPNSSFLEKVKGILGLALKRSIDLTALPVMAEEIKKYHEKQPRTMNDSSQQLAVDDVLPKVVMLSSAGVTRPVWDEKKKELMPGAADIPIVRLNPFGALDIKRESEEKLRETGMQELQKVTRSIMLFVEKGTMLTNLYFTSLLLF